MFGETRLRLAVSVLVPLWQFLFFATNLPARAVPFYGRRERQSSKIHKINIIKINPHNSLFLINLYQLIPFQCYLNIA